MCISDLKISTQTHWLRACWIASWVVLSSLASAKEDDEIEFEDNSVEIEFDDEPMEQPSPPPPSSFSGSDSPQPQENFSSICDIDPTACPKQIDPKTFAKREVSADLYAVQQIYALRRHRFELQPYWAFTLNDQFVSHPAPGFAANYYITNTLAIGANGNLYAGLNIDSAFNFQNRRATRVAVPLNEYQWNGNLNLTYVPIYGKFAGMSDFIFHYDVYMVGGAGALSTRPIAVIDPDNRKFEFKPKLTFNGGVGLRIFINRWLAANLEIRDYLYNEQLESLNVASTQVQQRDPSTWLGAQRLTHNVQAQLGISLFLPLSWQYRLPK